MVSKRQQILTAIKDLVELDNTLYNDDTANTSLINIVHDEKSRPRRGKRKLNSMDVFCPDDVPASYSTHAGKKETSVVPVRVRMALPNHDGDNDHVYQLMENFRQLMWDNCDLGLSFVSNVHVDEDFPRVKPTDVTFTDGAISDLRVLYRESF
jgi:hypothetical protein